MPPNNVYCEVASPRSSEAKSTAERQGVEDQSWIEVLPDRLFYTSLTHAPSSGLAVEDESGLTTHFFSTDHSLVYWNFFLDFGPLNLGQTFRFCEALQSKLADPNNDRVVYYSSPNGQRQANSVFLLGAYAVIYMNKSAEEAFRPFAHLAPKMPAFHDATPGICTYKLSVLDCLRGMERAKQLGFLNFDEFDVEEYEHFEKVESGDLSWLFPGRFVAFAGPHDVKVSGEDAYPQCVPEDYVPHFRAKNVRLVVRLNKRYYDENRFKRAGVDHEELYYPDGSCPTDEVLDKFLRICESRPEGHAIAVHCKAGLGRTGTCIGAYAMKHWGFTAAEVIGWMRVARPGSVIGPQQQYLESIQVRMHRLGDIMRAQQQHEQHRLAPPPPPPSHPRYRPESDLDMIDADAGDDDDDDDDEQEQEKLAYPVVDNLTSSHNPMSVSKPAAIANHHHHRLHHSNTSSSNAFDEPMLASGSTNPISTTKLAAGGLRSFATVSSESSMSTSVSSINSSTSANTTGSSTFRAQFMDERQPGQGESLIEAKVRSPGSPSSRRDILISSKPGQSPLVTHNMHSSSVAASNSIMLDFSGRPSTCSSSGASSSTASSSSPLSPLQSTLSSFRGAVSRRFYGSPVASQSPTAAATTATPTSKTTTDD